MKASLIIDIEIESEEKAKELLDIARDAVLKALDYETEDLVRAFVSFEN